MAVWLAADRDSRRLWFARQAGYYNLFPVLSRPGHGPPSNITSPYPYPNGFMRRPSPIVLLLLLLLSGCAGMPDQTANEPVQAVPDPAAEPRSSGGGLPPGMLYDILAGEIAGQRGRPDVAFAHYFKAAQVSRDPQLAERASRIAAFLKDESIAIKAVDLWLELAPEATDALQVAAVLHLRHGDTDVALEHLDALLKLLGAEHDNRFIQVAALLGKENDRQRALQVMRGLVERYPDNAEAAYANALLATQAQESEEAERSIRRVLELRPEWAKARVLFSHILTQQGDAEGARQVLEKGLKRNDDDRTLRIAYARLLLEDKDYAAAREQFLKVLAEHPEDNETIYALGVLALQREDPQDARSYFEELVDDEEHGDEAAYFLGQIAEDDEQTDAAIQWYGRVGPGRFMAEAVIRRAQLLSAQGQVNKGRELLWQLRSRAPQLAVRLYRAEAELLSEAGRGEEALRLYDGALREFPDNAELLYARALHAVTLDRLDILERDLSQILADDPEHADALNALGYTLADRTTRYQEALAYIERAMALKPDNAAILDSMGWVQYRLGNLREALDYLRRAHELMPDSEIAAHLGEVLWVLGERAEAREVWQRALVAEPDSELIRQVMDRFKQ